MQITSTGCIISSGKFDFSHPVSVIHRFQSPGESSTNDHQNLYPRKKFEPIHRVSFSTPVLVTRSDEAPASSGLLWQAPA
jgi:hypothetical protein